MSDPLDASLQLLDLDRESSLEDAKKARRALAMVWHPDRFADNQDLRRRAEDKLKDINAAYETVTDYLRIASPETPRPLAVAAPPPERAYKTLVLKGVPIHNRTITSAVGLEVGGGRFAEVITAGSTVPCAVSKMFTNARDFQTELTIRVCYGNPEAPASDATRLGTLAFVDLPPGPRGFMRMEVVFAVDDGGALAIRATDVDTNEPIRARPS
ncbi:MAG: Hsp70 family protein [Bacteroidota bacterium]